MKNLNRKTKHFLIDLLVSIVILSIAIFLSLNGNLDYANGRIYDLLFNIYRDNTEHCDNVIIACIDQKSIDYFEKNAGFGWPWPRSFYSFLVKYLTNCKARAIVFDVLFTEPDMNREEDNDSEFAAAIKESGIVYLSAAAQKTPITESSKNRIISDNQNHLFQHLKQTPLYNSVLYPLEEFSINARNIGLVNLAPDVDSINRKYPLVHQIGDSFCPSLAYAVVQGILDDKSMKKNVFDLIQNKSFIDREGNFLINWYGEGGTGRGGQETDGVFTYYSYHALIVAAIQKERSEESIISSEVFKDKIVLIGSNAGGLFEFHATPFSYRNLYPSLEIHATAIENMLSGDYIKSIGSWNLFLLIGFITFFLLLINIVFTDLRILLLAIIVILSGELLTSYFLLSTKHLWISSSEMLFSSISVFLGLVISGYLLESHEKKFIHTAFGKYLAPSVVDYLIQNPKMLHQMEGERREITVYFSDIEKFSTISEFLGPERLVKMLNEYFEEMTDIIQNHRGTVDRFEGDAIMAFYGAPVHFKNHAELACLACLEMQEKLIELRKKWQRDNIPEIYTRMGVNTGPVMVGNMGSFSRKQYSVVGDTVNLASRLESLNKIYGTYLMIGEETYKQVKHVIEVRELDRVRVVGKNQPVNVYELLSEKGMLSPSLSSYRDIFHKGIALYRERKWDEAIECFREVLNVFSEDGPSKLFISRCKDFKLHPPSDEWDFVTNLSIK